MSDTPKPLGRRAPRSPRKARQCPYHRGWLRVLLAVVARPAAHGRGAGAKATAARTPCSSAAGARAVGGSVVYLYPEAKAPSTIARLVILFGSDSYCHRLRSFRVAGWGWVAEIGGCIAGRAHPFGKSGLGFADTRTYRFRSAEVWIRWGVIGSKLLRSMAPLVRRSLRVFPAFDSLCAFPRNGHVAYARRYSSLYYARG